MPGKRSKYKYIQRSYCAYCNRRLWYLGNPKHFLCYSGISDHRNVIDSSSWLEEFFCGEHGNLWMRVTRKTSDTLVANLATGQDWQQTVRGIQPDTPPLKAIPSLKEDFYVSRGQ